jgi:hypothetical protein
MIVAIACFLDLNSERVTGDMMKMITPKLTLRERVKTTRRVKKKGSILQKLSYVRTALANTGKASQFNLVCSGSFVLFLGLERVQAMYDKPPFGFRQKDFGFLH